MACQREQRFGLDLIDAHRQTQLSLALATETSRAAAPLASRRIGDPGDNSSLGSASSKSSFVGQPHLSSARHRSVPRRQLQSWQARCTAATNWWHVGSNSRHHGRPAHTICSLSTRRCTLLCNSKMVCAIIPSVPGTSVAEFSPRNVPSSPNGTDSRPRRRS